MKKVKILLFIALACILVLPFSVFAEGEEETTSSNKEVTLYFFRGEGCSHCAEFESWLEEIEPEYGNLFEVKDDSYYGVSGLNPELNCIYIYNSFLKYRKVSYSTVQIFFLHYS